MGTFLHSILRMFGEASAHSNFDSPVEPSTTYVPPEPDFAIYRLNPDHLRRRAQSQFLGITSPKDAGSSSVAIVTVTVTTNLATENARLQGTSLASTRPTLIKGVSVGRSATLPPQGAPYRANSSTSLIPASTDVKVLVHPTVSIVTYNDSQWTGRPVRVKASNLPSVSDVPTREEERQTFHQPSINGTALPKDEGEGMVPPTTIIGMASGAAIVVFISVVLIVIYYIRKRKLGPSSWDIGGDFGRNCLIRGGITKWPVNRNKEKNVTDYSCGGAIPYPVPSVRLGIEYGAQSKEIGSSAPNGQWVGDSPSLIPTVLQQRPRTQHHLLALSSASDGPPPRCPPGPPPLGSPEISPKSPPIARNWLPPLMGGGLKHVTWQDQLFKDQYFVHFPDYSFDHSLPGIVSEEYYISDNSVGLKSNVVRPRSLANSFSRRPDAHPKSHVHNVASDGNGHKRDSSMGKNSSRHASTIRGSITDPYLTDGITSPSLPWDHHSPTVLSSRRSSSAVLPSPQVELSRLTQICRPSLITIDARNMAAQKGADGKKHADDPSVRDGAGYPGACQDLIILMPRNGTYHSECSSINTPGERKPVAAATRRRNLTGNRTPNSHSHIERLSVCNSIASVESTSSSILYVDQNEFSIPPQIKQRTKEFEGKDWICLSTLGLNDEHGSGQNDAVANRPPLGSVTVESKSSDFLPHLGRSPAVSDVGYILRASSTRDENPTTSFYDTSQYTQSAPTSPYLGLANLSSTSSSFYSASTNEGRGGSFYLMKDLELAGQKINEFRFRNGGLSPGHSASTSSVSSRQLSKSDDMHVKDPQGNERTDRGQLQNSSFATAAAPERSVTPFPLLSMLSNNPEHKEASRHERRGTNHRSSIQTNSPLPSSFPSSSKTDTPLSSAQTSLAGTEETGTRGYEEGIYVGCEMDFGNGICRSIYSPTISMASFYRNEDENSPSLDNMAMIMGNPKDGKVEGHGQDMIIS